MQKQKTEPSNSSVQTSPLELKQSKLFSVEWRTKQLVALAEVFKESLTPERLAMYVEALADLTDDQFQVAVGRSIRAN